MRGIESRVESYLIKQCTNLGIRCLKFIPDNQVGYPDRIVLLPNCVCIWVELKSSDGRLSPVQMYRHKELNNQGQAVVVLTSIKDVDNFIDAIKELVIG